MTLDDALENFFNKNLNETQIVLLISALRDEYKKTEVEVGAALEACIKSKSPKAFVCCVRDYLKEKAKPTHSCCDPSK